MDPAFWLAVAFAILASALLNIGKGVQKWKVRVLGQGLNALRPPQRRDLGIWLCGMAMTSAASPLFSLALKFADKPSTVSSLNGIGLIGLVLFAWGVIGERMGWREVIGAMLILVGTTVMGAFDEPAPVQTINMKGFLSTVGALGAVFLPAAAISWRTRRLHGLIFGALAGSLIGLAMLLGDIALLKANNDFIGQLYGPTVYIALLVGLLALAFTQVAFWRATAMVVVPTINSFVIFTPAVLQFFAFGTLLSAFQYLGILIIILGVILLTMSGKKS